jgi:hypothetical protein
MPTDNLKSISKRLERLSGNNAEPSEGVTEIYLVAIDPITKAPSKSVLFWKA